jgi:oxygen-independent coproporphyrinogen-3 oxidase
VDGLCTELEQWHCLLPEWNANTIFFGGGTPSLMKPEWIGCILNKIKSLWKCEPSEITLEANPTNAECIDLAGFRRAGINRISFGVQTFNPQQLLKLGRTHTGDQAREIVIASKELFPRVSLDLMYNLPGQTIEEIAFDLETVIALQIQHVSYYALTIHENTVFGQQYKANRLILPDEELFCTSYELIHTQLTEYGMQQYEISNFAFPGHQALHNLGYWKYYPFLGVGPGAHSRISLDGAIYAVENHKLPEKWLANLAENLAGKCVFEKLPAEITRQEELLMKLRLLEGLDLDDITRLLPEDIWNKLNQLEAIGAVQMRGNGFGLTSSGLLKYNSILRYLALDM